MFASKRTITIETEYGDVVISALGWRKLDRSRKAVLAEAQEQLMSMGGPSVMAAFRDAGGEDAVREAAVEQLGEERLYSQQHILADGVVSIDGRDVEDGDLDDLDQDVAHRLFLKILTLSRVTVSAEDAKATTGEDSPLSMTS